MRRIHPSGRPRRPRLATHIACQIVRLSDFKLVADRILDISESGMLVAPAEPVLTGEQLVIAFQAPHWGRWIDADAFVTRVIHGRRPGDACRQLGITYEISDVASRFVLEQAMRWMPPAPPRVRAGRRGTMASVRRLVASSFRVADASLQSPRVGIR